jgi:O-acetyl-ADP-ribose deacetylase (regulator of RNase III)
MKETHGDLLALAAEGVFDVITHGCNCQGTMGAGIALQIKNRFPQAAAIDRPGAVPGTIAAVLLPEGLTVVNAYTQIHWGAASVQHRSKSPVNNYGEEMPDTQENRYRFIRSCMKEIKKHFPHKRIGLPLIGCGLAGGDWEVVKKIVEEELEGCDVTVVHYKK